MDIIFKKSAANNSATFYNEALANELVSGIFLNVTSTKDNILIVINDEDAKNFFAPDFTLQELAQYDIITLNDALRRLNSTTKKIILNLLPIRLFDLPTTNLEKVLADATVYINILKSIIGNYPNLNIYLSSKVQRTVILLQSLVKDRPIGLFVTSDNLTYIDVNFYIIGINMINPLILIQQIDLRKELMIDVSTEQDIAMAKTIFDKNTMTPADRIIYEKLEFITSYPNFLYQELE